MCIKWQSQWAGVFSEDDVAVLARLTTWLWVLEWWRQPNRCSDLFFYISTLRHLEMRNMATGGDKMHFFVLFLQLVTLQWDICVLKLFTNEQSGTMVVIATQQPTKLGVTKNVYFTTKLTDMNLNYLFAISILGYLI